MSANEWLNVMQKAVDYDNNLTPLIKKYGEMLAIEFCEFTELNKYKIKGMDNTQRWKVYQIFLSEQDRN